MNSFVERFSEGGKNGRVSDIVYCVKDREILSVEGRGMLSGFGSPNF